MPIGFEIRKRENRTESLTFTFAKSITLNNAKGYKEGLLNETRKYEITISGTDSDGRAVEA